MDYKQRRMEEFEKKFIIPKGHFHGKGWENVEGKHLWGKYSQDGGEALKSFLSTSLDEAFEEGKKVGNFRLGFETAGDLSRKFIESARSAALSEVLKEIEGRKVQEPQPDTLNWPSDYGMGKIDGINKVCSDLSARVKEMMKK